MSLINKKENGHWHKDITIDKNTHQLYVVNLNVKAWYEMTNLIRGQYHGTRVTRPGTIFI